MRKRSFLDVFRRHTPTSLAAQAMERFTAQYQMHTNAMASVALSILVWGPSLNSPSPVAQKRKDIHRALLEDGHNPLFSEDVSETGGVLSLRSQELSQAMSVELIIVLMEDAPGAHAELEGLCMNPLIAPKVYVFIPERYRGSYSGQGAFALLDRGYGCVYWYQDDELRECNVLTRAVDRARARREIYAPFLILTATPARGTRS